MHTCPFHVDYPAVIIRSVAAVVLSLGFSIGTSAAVSIDAVYFAQTHVQRPGDLYFGLVGSRDALIKAHVVDPGTPASPPVTATLTLDGQTLDLPLTGPATLPASIPDGPGVVQHSFADSFTATLPAAWVQPGLEVTVTAGTASVDFTSLEIGAPTKVIMRMFDIQYFFDTNGDYPAGTLEELEAKWPVADLEVRRLPHVVFPELVIPPRGGAPAARVTSKDDYLAQTGLSFDGEQAAALAWNGALKRAGGRSGRIYLSYINIYGANAGGQAGGFSGVGNGTSAGILHHELGHALSLPHWGNSASYPYKGSMYGIDPRPSNETHAGPTWAFDPGTQTFIPPTTIVEVSPGVFEEVYKIDPMQGGGTGDQEAPFLLNHFSDYSENQMRHYLEGHVLVWNETLGRYAAWNQGDADYTSTVSNDGVKYPIEHDAEVVTVMASISGAKPDVNMVYPPVGPYVGGLIKRFDPTDASDRAEARAIFAPSGGCDVSVRVVQGGVEKIYMLAASWNPSADPLSGGSLITEAVNLPASDGEVTRVELLLTPDAEDNGLPADPQVLYTWSPVLPDPAAFEVVPTAGSSTAITMTARPGSGSGGPVEYLFTETTGNPGGTSSGWQTSRSYTDTGLQPETLYAYTLTMRSGSYTGRPSDEAYATTGASNSAGTITVDSSQQFSLQSGSGLKAVTGLGGFDAAGADKLVVVVSTEHGFNNGDGFVNEVRYNGTLLTEVVQEDAGAERGTAAIFHLDNPGPIGAGTIEISASNPNGGIGAAYALSGTTAGYGATNQTTGDSVTSVSLTTSGDNSMVIAVIDNAGLPNSAGTPTAIAPLTQVSSGVWGSQWGGHASGYLVAPEPDPVTPRFITNTGSGYSINIAAAEFLAEPIPAGTNFADWIEGYPGVDGETGFADDPDDDGNASGLENFYGTDPSVADNAGLVSVTASGNTFIFTHPQNPNPAADITAAYRWSKDLVTFHRNLDTDGDGTTVAFTTKLDTPSPGITTVTATLTGTSTDKLFVALEVMHN